MIGVSGVLVNDSQFVAQGKRIQNPQYLISSPVSKMVMPLSMLVPYL